MEFAHVIDWSRDAIRLALLLSGPPLAVALAVGLLIGIGQTLTQLHEPVVAMVPRLVAVILVVLVTLPWLISHWVAFMTQLVDAIPGSL